MAKQRLKPGATLRLEPVAKLRAGPGAMLRGAKLRVRPGARLRVIRGEARLNVEQWTFPFPTHKLIVVRGEAGGRTRGEEGWGQVRG